jgi:hypothetical protein
MEIKHHIKFTPKIVSILEWPSCHEFVLQNNINYKHLLPVPKQLFPQHNKPTKCDTTVTIISRHK